MSPIHIISSGFQTQKCLDTCERFPQQSKIKNRRRSLKIWKTPSNTKLWTHNRPRKGNKTATFQKNSLEFVTACHILRVEEGGDQQFQISPLFDGDTDGGYLMGSKLTRSHKQCTWRIQDFWVIWNLSHDLYIYKDTNKKL